MARNILFLIIFYLYSSCSSSASAVAAAASGKQTIEEYLQSLSTIPEVINRRDPFEVSPAPFKARPVAAPVVADTIDQNAPILLRYPIEEYLVVAVLLGDVYPRALVRAAKGGADVFIVKEKDKLGNKGGIITKITDEGLVILQRKREESGFVGKAEFKLRVGDAKSGSSPSPNGGKSGS